MMRRILVTGGGGYIGSVLVPLLLQEGYDVRVIDRLFFGRERLPESRHLEVIKEDVRRLTSEHLEGVDGVIDLAAMSNDASGELFNEVTWAVNHQARAGCAALAKKAGVRRYVLPSSCSIYGFQAPDVVCDEDSPTNPLTTYAKANEAAEQDVLTLADERFCVVVLRQATVYGLSPRMRFDLAINGMTYGAWKTRRLPLMRDGSQWRPMIHVEDTARAQMFMLTAETSRVNGQIFNVGSAENVYQIGPLGEVVAQTVGEDVEIEWYGDPDHRSYRVSFDKIEEAGWKSSYVAQDGVVEIVEALEEGRVDRTTDTITLDWYRSLIEWQGRIRDVEIDGSLMDLSGAAT